MIARRYAFQDSSAWNEFVASSREGTFLFQRGFMDYHSDRFTDFSLIFEQDGKWIGCLPACIEATTHTITAHGGLTYGTLLTQHSVKTPNIKEMLQTAAATYQQAGVQRIIFKPTPYIYHQGVAEELLYWLFRANATLIARALSTTIDLSQPLHFSSQRKRGYQKALRQNCIVEQVSAHSVALSSYWSILTSALEQHGVTPVHTLKEIKLLMQRFPRNISLYIVRQGDNIIAGSLFFHCRKVLHAQYIAANEEGRKIGALDFLFIERIHHSKESYQTAPMAIPQFFDFGISTEKQGRWLNEGLLHQKEGFGGHGVCYDAYEVAIDGLLALSS